ncbi:GNAT family N-acetyltransferase [Nocardioides ferulae]|uniref:GNAT family N-acetyltransferase n=1 Tax=Nocardioides ferulae TaxID=2340821 RepID=UPI000EAF4899|nr:GNAT family N-acetyltransferase [Nocardioides ferulae]
MSRQTHQFDGSPLWLDPVVPDRDADLLHHWVAQERARFWMMQEHSRDEVHAVYTWIDEQPTHHAWLVRLGEEPVALLQDYQPTAEEVGEHYEVLPGDLGLHFMLAPADTPRHGLTAAVFRFVLATAFADPAVQRLVVEPDARNDKAVALVRRIGMRLGPVVPLSAKPAQLAFLTRAAYTAAYG